MNVPSRPLTITEVISSTPRVDSWRSAPERPSLWQTTHSIPKIAIPFTGGEVTAGPSDSEVGGGTSGSGSEVDGGTSTPGSEVDGGSTTSGSEVVGASGSGSDVDGGISTSGSKVGGGASGSGSVVGTSGAETTGASVVGEVLVAGAWVVGVASVPLRSSGSGLGSEMPGASAAAAATSVGAEVSGAALYAVVGADMA